MPGAAAQFRATGLVLALVLGSALLTSAALAADSPEIRGRIVEDDAPVAGAWVELSPLVGRWALGDLLLQGKTRPEPVRRAVSRADGSFALRAPASGTWRLVVGGAGFVPAQLALIPAYRDVVLQDVELRADQGLALRVVDALGRPVARAAVVAWVRSEAGFQGGLPAPAWQRGTEIAFTDEDGRVRLAGAYGESLHLQVVEPRHPPASLQVQLPAPGELEVRLERGRRVTLRAVDPAGEPVPGVLVWLGAEPFPIGWTGDDGSTGLTLPRRAGLTLGLASEAGHSAAYTVSALTDVESVRVPLADPVRWAGRVLRRGTQEPVHDAVVWSWYRPDRSVHSDAAGWFRLDGVDPKGSLVAVRDGYLPGQAQVAEDDPGGGAQAVLQLVATARIEGLVVDESGEPVVGIGVRSLGHNQWLSESALLEWPARTGADGAFSLADVVVESELNLAVGGRDAAGVLWSARVESAEPLAPGEVRSGVVLHARRGLQAHGVVVDEQDRPVAGARVTLSGRLSQRRRLRALRQPEGHDCVTDASGAWRIEALAPDVYDLHIQATGFAPAQVPGLDLGNQGADGSGHVRDLGTVVLVPGVDLAGRVVDPDGRPVAGAQVSLHLLDEPGGDGTVTADDGSFELHDLRRGDRLLLTASHPDFVHGVAGPLAVPSPEPVELVLERSATVYGQVRDERGWPVAEARVVLLAQGGGGASRGGSPGVATDEQGAFTVVAVPAGPATLQVTHQDFPMHSEPVEVLAPHLGATRVDVALRTAEGSLRGRIADQSGEPVAAALVLLPGDGIQRPASAHSDAAGAYHVRNVDPGRREVVVHHPAFASFRSELDVTSGSWLDVELQRGHSVHGVVVDGDGLPVTGASILTSPLDAAAAATRQGAESAADGSWTLERLLPGRYLIEPRAFAYFVPRRPEPITVDHDLDGVVLEMRRGVRLEGTVLGADFDELGDVRVVAYRLESELGDTPMPSVTGVDYEGRFALDGLSPGIWSVGAELGSGRRAAERVEVADRPPEPLVLRFGEGFDLTGTLRLGRRDVPSVTIVLSPEQTGPSASRSTSVQYDGRFEFRDVPDGVYSLAVLVPGGVLWWQQVDLRSSVELVLEPPIAGVAGTVRDAAGRTLGDVRLHLRQVASGDGLAAGGDTRPFEVRSSTSTGDDGRFRIEVLQPGSYELTLVRSGFADGSWRVELPEGITTELELTLERSADSSD